MSDPLPQATTTTTNTQSSGKTKLGLLTTLFQEWKEDSRGRRIMGCWVGGLVIASLWGLVLRSRHKRQQLLNRLQTTKQNDDEEQTPITPENPSDVYLVQEQQRLKKLKKNSLRNVCSMALFGDKYNMNPNSSSSSLFSWPILWSVVVCGALVYKTQTQSTVNDTIGRLGELVVRKKWKLLASASMDFAVHTMYAAIAAAMVLYFKQSLVISMRYTLTSNLQSKYCASSSSSSSSSSSATSMMNAPPSSKSHDEKHDVHASFGDTDVNNSQILSKVFQSISNVNNRITNDCRLWSRTYASCFVAVVIPVIDVSHYSHKLANRLGIYHFSQCMLYFVLSSFWTRSILPSRSMMSSIVSAVESDFQAHHERLCEYSEEIHFLGGNATELRFLYDCYEQLHHKLRWLNKNNFLCQFLFNYVVRYMGILMSFISLLPMIESESMPTEFLLNNLHDLINIGMAFRNLLTAQKDMQALVGISYRITELDEKFHQLHQENNQTQLYCDFNDDDDHHQPPQNNRSSDVTKAQLNIDLYNEDEDADEDEDKDNEVSIFENSEEKQQNSTDDAFFSHRHGRQTQSLNFGTMTKFKVIEFQNVSVYTPSTTKVEAKYAHALSTKAKAKAKAPTKHVLIRNLDFCIRLGENVLIVGPNGSGKSSLLRVIAGVWNNCHSGNIYVSNLLNEKPFSMLFLPQRAYLVPHLSMKQQIFYPDIENNGSDPNESMIDENEMRILLSEAGFGLYLIDHQITDVYHGWKYMSGGEKQLIGLIRILVRKPLLAFIDESCNAVSETKVRWFYKKCSEFDITLVSISHHSALLKPFHDKTLVLTADGTGNYSTK